MTDDSRIALQHLKSLRQLFIWSTNPARFPSRITDKGLMIISRTASQLDTLSLIGVSITDEGRATRDPKGACEIRDAVRRRVYQSVGRVYSMPNGKIQPYNDGWRTTDKVGKMNIIHYGQHATATCCRKCIERWHSVPRRRALNEKEQEYIVALLMAYITFKLPELASG